MELTDEQKHRATLVAIMELGRQAESINIDRALYLDELLGNGPGTLYVDGVIDLVAVVEAISVVL